MRCILLWTGSHKVRKMCRQRKPLLHLTGYFAMVLSGFFL